MPKANKRHIPDSEVKKAGMRSKLELAIAQQLECASVAFQYEKHKIFYVEPAKLRCYTPDFLLLHSGIFIETKGYWDNLSRKKHMLIKTQWPALDIRMLFMRSQNTISKTSKTTYADFCRKNGIIYADLCVPASWVNLTKTKEDQRQIATILKTMSKDAAIKNYMENFTHDED